jgi:hypothetical protein
VNTREQKVQEARRRLKGNLRNIGKGCLALFLLIPIIWAISFFFGSVFYPWSSPLFGTTLTGTWVGKLQIPKDPIQRVFAFHIQLDSDSEEGEPIKGTADICDSAGLHHKLYLRGTTNFRGASVTLYFPNNPDFMDVQSKLRIIRSQNKMTVTLTTKDKKEFSFFAEKSDEQQFQELCRQLSEPLR